MAGRRTGITLEPGSMIWIWGRVAEVICPTQPGGPAVVEVTDAGGISRDYTVGYGVRFSPMIRDNECALDSLQRVNGPNLSPHAELFRVAEVWLADPKVGDEFIVEHGYHLKLTEIWDDGVIVAVKSPLHRGYPLASSSETSYKDAKQLRQWLELRVRPVYRARAFATRRTPDERNKLILYRGE